MDEGLLFRIESIPNTGLESTSILEQAGGSPFAIIYDFESYSTLLYISSDNPYEKINTLARISEGLSFSQAGKAAFGKVAVYSFYKSIDSTSDFLFSDIFKIGINSGKFGIMFCPIKNSDIGKTKLEMEKMLGSMPSKSNLTWRGFVSAGKADSTSFQHDLFERSEESMLLKEALEQINFSITSNGIAYKISLFASMEPEYGKIVRDYIRSKVLQINEKELSNAEITDIADFVGSSKQIPFGSITASKLLKPYGNYEIKYIIKSKPVLNPFGITVGMAISQSGGSEVPVKMPQNLFNLGTIISGLPGTGKTSEAMGIVSQMNNLAEKPLIAILSPTSEWSGFCESIGMNVVKLCEDGFPINFFAPPNGISIKKFYQDLSMLLASASEPGPYQKPLEKCLLNAFRRYYQTHVKINPISLFDEIQESIIELHGSRTNTGVKYTKHGENIKSSLESLIEILQFPEYSEESADGIERLLNKGVVFDVSSVSFKMKTFFYALILNQLYSIASKFDINGDLKLRMLICIEEAQLLFKDPKSATVEDIRSRIQDFRKLGVGVMLLVHSITDIDQDIRRLCQSKIYLKQPPDVAKKASEDLVFNGIEEAEVVLKLKHLESGHGALNYVFQKGHVKINPDTIFIRTLKYGEFSIVAKDALNAADEKTKQMKRMGSASIVKAKISIIISKSDKKMPSYARLVYLTTFIFEIPIVSQEVSFEYDLINGREYYIEFLSENKKTIRKRRFISGREIKIEL